MEQSGSSHFQPPKPRDSSLNPFPKSPKKRGPTDPTIGKMLGKPSIINPMYTLHIYIYSGYYLLGISVYQYIPFVCIGEFLCIFSLAMKKTWLFRVYRGWNPTQLCEDYSETIITIPFLTKQDFMDFVRDQFFLRGSVERINLPVSSDYSQSEASLPDLRPGSCLLRAQTVGCWLQVPMSES